MLGSLDGGSGFCHSVLMTNNKTNNINAFTIAARGTGYHLTVETPNSSPAFAYLGNVDNYTEALQVALDAIAPAFAIRCALGGLILGHLAAKPCELVDVDFSLDGIVDVTFFFGGFVTDAYHVHANSTIARLVD